MPAPDADIFKFTNQDVPAEKPESGRTNGAFSPEKGEPTRRRKSSPEV
jgi:hypothetical protein